MTPDLFQRWATPLLEPLRAALAAAEIPESARLAGNQFLDLSGLLVLAALLAAGARRPTPGEPPAPASTLISTALAVALGVWLLTHPSPSVDGLIARWDALAFAVVAGRAAIALAQQQRKTCLAAVSALLLTAHCGVAAVAVLVGLTAAGLAWGRTRLGSRRGGAVLGHAALLVGLYVTLWLLQWREVPAGLAIHGLIAFATLRYISLMIATFGAPAPSLPDWAMYTTFYPGITGLFGAPEVYSEFARRNLARPAVADHRAAARAIGEGVLLMVAAAAVPMSFARVEASRSAFEAWPCAALLFVKTALGVTGAWRVIHATALCFGVRLRMNFTGLLTCRTPSELWWAWRGTMTNWLVQHVYAPLGASHRHQVLNILAAFAVSALWHVLAVLSPQLRWPQVAAITLWAAINAVAVTASAKMPWRAGAAASPVWRTVQIPLMWALGALTPMLLSLSAPGTPGDRLAHLVRLLIGLS
jgi:hypothetical protein